jgi:dUTP pyrophosphatase
MNINYTRLTETAITPKYSTPHSAGLDLYADGLDSTDYIVLLPGARRLISTGISIEIPRGFYALMAPRSGLALRHGITLANAPGTIDSDYRGEIGVILINHGNVEYILKQGDKIAQLIILPALQITLDLVDTLSSTDRDGGGFGSTGK